MLNATTTSEDLLRRVKDWREDEGWREFYRRYAPAVAEHARRSGLTHEEAEDVVQTTMVKVGDLPADVRVRPHGLPVPDLAEPDRQPADSGHRAAAPGMRLPEQAWVYLSELVAGVVNPAADPVAQAESSNRCSGFAWPGPARASNRGIGRSSRRTRCKRWTGPPWPSASIPPPPMCG